MERPGAGRAIALLLRVVAIAAVCASVGLVASVAAAQVSGPDVPEASGDDLPDADDVTDGDEDRGR